MKKRVAILVDGTFFIKRNLFHFHRTLANTTPQQMATAIHNHCLKHIRQNDDEELYRIFFYDCKPLTKKAHYPLSGKSIELSKEPTYTFKMALFKELVDKPCLALRFGYLDEKNAEWIIKDESKRKKFLKGLITTNDLTDQDYMYLAKQKGVDMKIGLDIASLSLKKLVQKIVLISGDSDFVPAAKLARREGIHFVLDPMGNQIRPDLEEHIDWLKTTLPNFKKQQNKISSNSTKPTNPKKP